MKMVLDVLASQGELEWARCVGGVQPLRPPLVAWRYKTADVSLERRIIEAVQRYTGSVEWIARKGEHNWVIEPAAFHAYAMNFRVDVEALQRYGEEHPAEATAALNEAPHLAAYLAESLKTGDR